MPVPGSSDRDRLTIRGEKKQQVDDNSERIHRFERTYGMFERTFVLPNIVDTEQIDARYDNGVLHVSIPKAERAKPREIRVNASNSGSSQIRTGAQSQRVCSGNSQRSGGNDRTRDPEEEGSAAKSSR